MPSGTTRRQFLRKGVAIAASAIAVPSVIPFEVLAKPRLGDRIGLGLDGEAVENLGSGRDQGLVSRIWGQAGIRD